MVTVPRIVGGSEASEHEYPWLVYLHMISSKENFGCGGSLITRSFVLTAAHCASGDVKEIYVYVGTHDLPNVKDTSSAIKVSKIIIHEDYDSYNRKDDIALLKLSKKVTFNREVGPACLGVQGDVKAGDKVIVAGWGKLKSGGDQKPKKLMEVELDVVDEATCSKAYTGTVAITGNMMCTYTKGKDACVGDSGGPLVAKVGPKQWSQVGVVSFGSGCAGEIPGVYTRVSKYHKWITDHISEKEC
ncbi:chymotrypsin-like elastase family member 2A isoform X2 [Panulirus ornatus]